MPPNINARRDSARILVARGQQSFAAISRLGNSPREISRLTLLATGFRVSPPWNPKKASRAIPASRCVCGRNVWLFGTSPAVQKPPINPCAGRQSAGPAATWIIGHVACERQQETLAFPFCLLPSFSPYCRPHWKNRRAPNAPLFFSLSFLSLYLFSRGDGLVISG